MSGTEEKRGRNRKSSGKKVIKKEINEDSFIENGRSEGAKEKDTKSKPLRATSNRKRKCSLEHAEYPHKIKIGSEKVTKSESSKKIISQSSKKTPKSTKKAEVTNKDVKSTEKMATKEVSSTKKKVSSNKTTDKKIKKGGVINEPILRPEKYENLGNGPRAVPFSGKMYVGCHVSGAGGVWNAFENAEECKAKSFALFLRNQRQWVAKPLDDDTVVKWKKAMNDLPPHLILPHGSYLMNLGSPVPETLEKSRGMLLEEIQRCERLGIPHFNFHPGSTLGKISRLECCKTIAESINIVHEQTKGVICVLENMSCQGFTIGGDFHELRCIIEHVKDKARVGVCLDTCHAHAAGYDLGTEAGFQNMLCDFEKIVGWQFLRGVHINDSKGHVGDHLDRHENIGRGKIGKEGFRRIVNCEHFRDLPLILETPWTSNEGYAKEIKILESLIGK
ncbi:Xylose isomerase-like TIM barrel [Halocaridina rubra]|uniref:Xylose isomerase-like TIM barrel n=1 Tax=Halocaridina rubra TaxID=373956 RepID=A0AAN8WV74_HALRR